MELYLSLQPDGQAAVVCNGQPSHNFDPTALAPRPGGPPQPLENPQGYGQAVFAALFPDGSPARQSLEAQPDRVVLVTQDNTLDALPWEYAYGPQGFVVQNVLFVRSLPVTQRIPAPPYDGHLHIMALPSALLSDDMPPLRIETEWTRLAEDVREIAGAVTLERVHPPTLDQLALQLSSQCGRVLHFIGDGTQTEHDMALLFQGENGTEVSTSAQDLEQQVRGAVLLVTLNTYASTIPRPTPFSNLAAALIRRRIPYALGMRCSILDEDARTFARTFYSSLAQGTSVEEALRQTRLALVVNHTDVAESWSGYQGRVFRKRKEADRQQTQHQ